MSTKTKMVDFTYKAMRTAAAKLYYLRYDLQYMDQYSEKKHYIPKEFRINNDLFRQYRKKWLPWSDSFLISKKELEIYCFYGKNRSIDFMPSSVYFTTIDPILNDKQMSWGYSEKGNYAKLFGIDNEPLSILRYINGLYLDFGGNIINDPEKFLDNKLKSYSKILIKPAVDSWGGRNIIVFERDKSGQWKCLNQKIELDLKYLVKFYQNSFVIQEFLEQHPYYERFNPSSFNTIRIYSYRSPVDETVHILHSILKAGQAGSVVDNLKAGGVAFYIKPDGTVLPGKTMELVASNTLPNEPETQIEDLDKAPGFEEMHDLVKKITLQLPYHRLAAFDINIDISGRPRLVELNLSEAGNGVQIFGYPFLGEFTDEVIEYCKSKKKIDFLRI
ncbi:sugar-transfer associated ATP-grasp domain-containing protein [Thermophagus sp. OGC60D27]|uniref:sugar-transfer associated ATP-grasp domain-containing protein n=1 Tax=Thermophagus sp. OGC60D27 TaxID=3458415 RepID=UPI0040382B17